MNENMLDALQVQQDEESAGDRERSYIVKEMMGDTYATFFEEEDTDHPDPERLAMEAEYKRDAIREEIALNHAQDNKF